MIDGVDKQSFYKYAPPYDVTLHKSVLPGRESNKRASAHKAGGLPSKLTRLVRLQPEELHNFSS
jgi:hypothetical protein